MLQYDVIEKQYVVEKYSSDESANLLIEVSDVAMGGRLCQRSGITNSPTATSCLKLAREVRTSRRSWVRRSLSGLQVAKELHM